MEILFFDVYRDVDLEILSDRVFDVVSLLTVCCVCHYVFERNPSKFLFRLVLVNFLRAA